MYFYILNILILYLIVLTITVEEKLFSDAGQNFVAIHIIPSEILRYLIISISVLNHRYMNTCLGIYSFCLLFISYSFFNFCSSCELLKVS